MNQSIKCVVSKVSTLDRFLAKVQRDLPRPICFIIFGADGEFKNRITEQVVDFDQGENSWSSLSDTKVGHLITMFRFQHNYTVVCDYNESNDSDLKQCVQTALAAGAQNTVGIQITVAGAAAHASCSLFSLQADIPEQEEQNE